MRAKKVHLGCTLCIWAAEVDKILRRCAFIAALHTLYAHGPKASAFSLLLPCRTGGYNAAGGMCEHIAQVFPGCPHKRYITLKRKGSNGAPLCMREQAASNVGCFVLAS